MRPLLRVLPFAIGHRDLEQLALGLRIGHFAQLQPASLERLGRTVSFSADGTVVKPAVN
jgi:hypothetical protein